MENQIKATCCVSGRVVVYPEPICYVGESRVSGLKECVAGLKKIKQNLPENQFIQVANTFELHLPEINSGV